MAKTVAFCTLGCKVNQYDSQAMLERFEGAGYVPAPFSGPADVYVVNTCTVTGTGDKKSRQMIRRAHKQNPGASIVVTGCMAQRAAEALCLPGVSLVLGTQRRGEVVQLLEAALDRPEPLIAVEPLRKDTPFEALTVRGSDGRTRATLKIQEGCQNHCTYCIIPSVRGPIRSRPLTEVAEEAARLSAAGFLEIVVTGIHLSSYGADFSDGTNLLDALRAIHRAEGVRRIRLGSLEPGIMTEGFVAALREMPKICPQFMLALQSGSDAVLRRMGRRYTTLEYAKAAGLLRRAYPDAALTTDLMTGFPEETEAEFQETMAFVEEIGFARIHVFPYSERAGTRAAAMPGAVPRAEREGRAARLIALGERLAATYAERFVGRRCGVLFEEEHSGSDAMERPVGSVMLASGFRAGNESSTPLAYGYTPEYLRVCADGVPGMLQMVRIISIENGVALGKVEAGAEIADKPKGSIVG